MTTEPVRADGDDRIGDRDGRKGDGGRDGRKVTATAATVTRRPNGDRRGFGPLGRRLLMAFVLVALSSVAVLTAAALVGTARGLVAGQQNDRTASTSAVLALVDDAYRRSGGWAGADLSAADARAVDAGARLVVRDATDTLVAATAGVVPGNDGHGGMGSGGMGSGGMGSGGMGSGGMGSGGMGSGGMGSGGMGSGMGSSGTVVVEPIVVDGTTVGSLRLVFGTGTVAAAQQVAWTWILVAALVALATAVAVSRFVAGRITLPLHRLSLTARAFAAGDRSARAAADDVRAPGELGELARAFDATAAQVERSEQARRRMAADLAHELRTPLAVLQAGLEELRDGLVAPDRAALAALHHQSLRVGRVVGDLAELSAAETAALSLQRSPIDLGELVDDAVAAARPTLVAAGLTLRTALSPGVRVTGDVDRLHQVVGNLLVNTARHCRGGDQVSVSVAADPDWACLVVADTGPGIAAADLPQVFDRLWRGRADADPGGSGIGLAVVRELVQAHGGTVVATSDGATGTTVTVRLPLSQREPARRT